MIRELYFALYINSNLNLLEWFLFVKFDVQFEYKLVFSWVIDIFNCLIISLYSI